MKPQRLSLHLPLLLTLSAPLATAQTVPPGPPTSAASAMYTLQDLWNRLNAGTAGTLRTGPFTEPSVAPGVKTMHTLNELMAVAPALDSTYGATTAQVLSGMSFWGLRPGVGWGLLNGTMASNGAVTIIPGTASQAIPAGYHNGSGTVAGDTNLVAANIKTGVSIFGVTGSLVSGGVDTSSGTATAGDIKSGLKAWVKGAEVTGTMASNGAVTIIPGTTAQTIPVGYHNGSGTVAGDADLVATNIKSGVSIFGVTGSLTPVGEAPSFDDNVFAAQTQTVIAGQVTTFTVSATGSGLHYVWQKDGVNVGTDAATLTLPFPLTTDAGNYRVTVWNDAGYLTSSAATLTVSPLAITLPNGGLGLDLKPIPTGTFLRSDNATITVSTFFMGTYEVTQAQYLAVTGSNPSHFTGDTTRPVEMVSYNDATTFLVALNLATTGMRPAGLDFRLPTEAEWEYACRAGTTTTYYWGSAVIDNFAWYTNNSGSTTHPVGQKGFNAWGLYDMAGNVLEWCQDWHVDPYLSTPTTDPAGPSNGTSRVFRGGSWGSGSYYCRSDMRVSNSPDLRDGNVGFRVVLAPPRTP